MPTPNGINGAALSGQTPFTDQLLQLDFVDAVCSAGGTNTLSVPELLTSVVNFLQGAGLLIGAIVVLGIAAMAYGFSKMGSATGGGGGKGYLVGGGIVFVGGVFAGAIPNVVEQSMDGGGSCFATITVPPQVFDAAMTVATVAL